MHFLSRFLSVITVTSLVQAMLISAQQPLGSAVATPLSKSDVSKSSPLDFTQLPRDLQNIVLGYLGKGWQKADSVKYHANLKDVYYLNDVLLVAEVVNRLKPVIFGQSAADAKFVSNLEDLINTDVTWHIDDFRDTYTNRGRTVRLFGNHETYGKNYRAQSAFGDIYFYKLNNEAPDILQGFDTQSICTQVDDEDGYPNIILGNMVLIMCFSPDECYFAVRQAKGKLAFYNLKTGKLLKHFKTEPIFSLAISPDNKYIAAGIAENGILLIDVASGAQTIIYKESMPEKENKPCTRAVTFSPDGKYLMAGTDNGQVHKFEFQPDFHDLK